VEISGIELHISENGDMDTVKGTETTKMYGSILKHPGKVKKRPMIKHVEFLDNLTDQDSTVREY